MGGQHQGHAVPEGGLADFVAEQGHAQQCPGGAAQQGAEQQGRFGDAAAVELGLGLVPAVEEEGEGAEDAKPDQEETEGVGHGDHLHFK